MTDWTQLKKTCAGCTACGLCQTRHNVVFGVGNEAADVMFIGEGPGEQEDLQGEPFVGPAGRLLDDMLSIIDLDRKKNCYIANIVKCRPPRNRDPQESEQDACIGYLHSQIDLLHIYAGHMAIDGVAHAFVMLFVSFHDDQLSFACSSRCRVSLSFRSAF